MDVTLVRGVILAGTRRGGLVFGDVLGLHQAVHDLQGAVVADGDDAPGDGGLVGTEDGAGLDGLVDLREARLDGLGLLDQLVGPLVLVHVDQLVVPAVQALDLGALLVRGLGRGGTDPPEAGKVGPVDVETGLGPLPAGGELVGRRLQAVQASFISSAGSSSQTPFSYSSAKRSRSTGPPAAS